MENQRTRAEKGRLLRELQAAEGSSVVEDLFQLLNMEEQDVVRKLRDCSKDELDGLQKQLKAYETVRGWFNRPAGIDNQPKNWV